MMVDYPRPRFVVVDRFSNARASAADCFLTLPEALAAVRASNIAGDLLVADLASGLYVADAHGEISQKQKGE